MPNRKRWYRGGYATVVYNKDEVKGINTSWEKDVIKPGDIFVVEDDSADILYEIVKVNSDTSLTIRPRYRGKTDAENKYAIIRNFNNTLNADLASETAAIIRDLFGYYKSDVKELTGKSAYDIAVDRGFSGTEDEWLESLIGATFKYEDFTEEQLAALKGEKGDKLTFEDLTAEEKASLKGDKGDTGRTGPKGETGDSAFDVAVANGFQGSEEDWVKLISNPAHLTDSLESDDTTTGLTANRGKELQSEIGNLSDLETISKDSLVSAINESLEILDDSRPVLSNAVIPTTGWENNPNVSPDWPYYCDVAADVDEKDVVLINVSLDSVESAIKCGLCSINRAYDGKIRVWAKSIPTSAITVEYTVLATKA